MRGTLVTVGLFCALCGTGQFTGAAAAPASLYADHPLNGTLWDTRSGKRVDEEHLFAEAGRTKWILIGEKHDNAEHHRLQARLVGALGAAGRRLAVVWEMAEPEQAPALRDARLEAVEDLGRQLDWEARGWPAWSEYQAIAEEALKYQFPMFPGKPSRDLVSRFARGAALPDDIAARLQASVPYPSEIAALVSADMEGSHCGTLPTAALAPMVQVQWLWDASLAAGLREAVGPAGDIDGAVLIAGSGHVREDRAVPWHLAEESVTVSLVEVAAGRDTAADYASFDSGLFDYVWFTARVDENDPCDALRGSGEP